MPGSAARFLRGFPRQVVVGWLLTAIDICWVAYVLYHASLGRFDSVKPFLFVLAPLAIFLICFLLNEMLASRALGGLLLLLPNPTLSVIRWEDSSLRLFVSVLAYACVIIGIILTLSPCRLRFWIDLLAATKMRTRLTGFVALIIGLVTVLTGAICF